MWGGFDGRVVHRRRFVQLGIATLLAVAAGFTASGLSRLVVSTDTALLLGAPLLLGGFLLAIGTFGLAVLAKLGAVEIEDGDA